MNRNYGLTPHERAEQAWLDKGRTVFTAEDLPHDIKWGRVATVTVACIALAATWWWIIRTAIWLWKLV